MGRFPGGFSRGGFSFEPSLGRFLALPEPVAIFLGRFIARFFPLLNFQLLFDEIFREVLTLHEYLYGRV